MDERHLAAGEAAYAAGDWQHAALEFMAAAHGGPSEGAGHALHHAGNALVKLGRYADAVTVYQKASRDLEYPLRGAVLANLGAAYSAVGRYEDALESYTGALADPEYASPYKAVLGSASALYSLGRFEEAAQAFRQAAWGEGNPDPGKALNNLGLCFMSLGRPEDAVEAFKAALGIDGYGSKGKASANLGLAYAAMGFFEESVLEFESARDEYGYELTGAMLEAYEAARVRVRTEGAAPQAEPGLESVEEPGEDAQSESPSTDIEPPEGAVSAAPVLPDADDESTLRFFTMTEDDMRQEERHARKQERAEKRTPKVIVVRVLLALLALLVVAGAFGGAFYLGYGYPTQEQTVTGLLSAYQNGTAFTEFWVAVPPADVDQEMRTLPAHFKSFTIVGVDRASIASTVAVDVSLDTGPPRSFLVRLAREGVGWKVVGVKNRWGSVQN